MRRWHWTHGRGTGIVGTGRTDVAHGLLALDVRDVAARCKRARPRGGGTLHFQRLGQMPCLFCMFRLKKLGIEMVRLWCMHI